MAAAGTTGSLYLYNRTVRNGQTFVGKHSAGITCGNWSASSLNLLLLAARDNCISLVSNTGNTLTKIECQKVPLGVDFAPTSIR